MWEHHCLRSCTKCVWYPKAILSSHGYASPTGVGEVGGSVAVVGGSVVVVGGSVVVVGGSVVVVGGSVVVVGGSVVTVGGSVATGCSVTGVGMGAGVSESSWTTEKGQVLVFAEISKHYNRVQQCR